MLNRRNLFRLLGAGAVAAVAAPFIKRLPPDLTPVQTHGVVLDDFAKIAGKVMTNALEYKRDADTITLLMAQYDMQLQQLAHDSAHKAYLTAWPTLYIERTA